MIRRLMWLGQRSPCRLEVEDGWGASGWAGGQVAVGVPQACTARQDRKQTIYIKGSSVNLGEKEKTEIGACYHSLLVHARESVDMGRPTCGGRGAMMQEDVSEGAVEIAARGPKMSSVWRQHAMRHPSLDACMRLTRVRRLLGIGLNRLRQTSSSEWGT